MPGGIAVVAFWMLGVLLSKAAVQKQEQGHLAAAEQLGRQALAIIEAAYTKESWPTAVAMGNLASVLCAQDRLTEAQDLLRAALDITERTAGTDHPEYAHLLSSLSEVLFKQGETARAIPLARRALAILERTKENPLALGHAYQNVAVLYSADGNQGLAGEMLQRAFATWKGAIPPDHPAVIFARSTEILIDYRRKRYAKANARIPELLAMARAQLGSGHPELAVLLNNAAYVYDAQRRHREAAELLREATVIVENAFGRSHPKYEQVFKNYSFILRKLD